MRRAIRTAVVIAAALAAVLAAPSAQASKSSELAPPHAMNIRGSARGTAPGGNNRPTSGDTGIYYHGGPIIAGTTHAYVIWYGNWAGNTGQQIITDFLSNVGGSPYFNINTTYTNSSGTHVSNAVTLAGQTIDNYRGSSNLSDGDIQTITSSAITSGRLPKDLNGVYFVLTSSDVSKSGFLTSYCGWHTAGTISGSTIKYSFVGDPTGPNLGSCSMQSTSPNGNAGADAMVSVVAHELEEAVTDPQLNAWYDRRGDENADKCAWTFGTTYSAANGSTANMHLGTRDFLIQRNWVNAGKGGCLLAY